MRVVTRYLRLLGEIEESVDHEMAGDVPQSGLVCG
jgi:hypothetical protein